MAEIRPHTCQNFAADPKKEDLIADSKKESSPIPRKKTSPKTELNRSHGPPICPLPKALADFKSKARSEGNLGEYWGILGRTGYNSCPVSHWRHPFHEIFSKKTDFTRISNLELPTTTADSCA